MPGSPPPLLARGRSTGALPASAASLSPGSRWWPCRSLRSRSPPGPWKRATVVPWPPLVQRRGWRKRGVGQGKDGRSPVLPKVQGEAVPSGPQDVADTLWVQALGRGQGGVQGEALPSHAHLKPGGAAGAWAVPRAWGRRAAPPRPGPQASGRGQHPSQATWGRRTPAPTGQGGQAALSAQGTGSCKALRPPVPPPPRLQLTPQDRVLRVSRGG